jgi:hypothetical protein
MPGRLLSMEIISQPTTPKAQHGLAQQLLDALTTNKTITTDLLFLDALPADLKAAIVCLQSMSMIDYKQLIQSNLVLGEEGQEICASASPEYIVWTVVQETGKIGIKKLAVRVYTS